jgi:hypothetical protein
LLRHLQLCSCGHAHPQHKAQQAGQRV